MRPQKRIFILILLLFSINAIAQQKQIYTYSLQQAVDYAKQHNYDLRNAKLDVLQSQKKVNEVTAYGLPQINASANLINNIQIASQLVPNFVPGAPEEFLEIKFGVPYTSNISIGANQLVFDGTFFLGLKASKEFVNLSKLNENRTEIETEVNVSKAYYGVLLLDANESLIKSNIQSLTKTRDDLQQLFNNGFTEKIDVDRLTLQLSNLNLQHDKIRDQSNVLRMLLKIQMGLPITDSVVLTDNLQDLFANKKVTAFENETKYDNRVEYKLLKQQYSLNQLDKKRYLVGYMPTLYAFANQQYNAFASEGNFPNLYNKFYPGTNIGLSLNLPIFDGFRKHALTQQADISITKTENNMRLFENVVDQQVYQARTNFLRTTQQLEIQQSNLKLAEEIYSKAELKYKNGVGSSLELTTSQSDLENARTNLLTTAYEFFVAEIELKKALGMIK